MINFFKNKKKIAITPTPIPFDEDIKKTNFPPPRLIRFDNKLIFKPVSSQVIYIENSFQPQVNKFIVQNFENICQLFSKKGYVFCYIPLLNQNKLTTEVIEYYHPDLDKRTINHYTEEDKTIGYDDLLLKTKDSRGLFSGLIRYKGKTEDTYLFSYFEFTRHTVKELWTEITTYSNNIGDGTVFYSFPEPEKNDLADFNFPFEAKILVEEIKERIERLKKIGINEVILKSLLISDTKISRMNISKDYRIYLIDYNNKEIVMPPLPKAIFFLFLKHPEGILFKHLSEYKNELKQIYLKLTPRSESKDILESLNDVTDSTKNSINEKCSRIREAFVKEFDESLAKYYFITGDRATPKKIILDRKLVNFECDI